MAQAEYAYHGSDVARLVARFDVERGGAPLKGRRLCVPYHQGRQPGSYRDWHAVCRGT